MSTFLDDLLKKMKTAPHVGVPSVTNPKLPTKVERETAEYAARQKAMPNFKFGTGTPLERLQKQMVIAQHPTPTYADPKFNNTTLPFISKDVIDTWEAEFQSFFKQEEEKKRKEHKKTNHSSSTDGNDVNTKFETYVKTMHDNRTTQTHNMSKQESSKQ